MIMDKKIGFIGAGNMAFAIINGILKSGGKGESLYAFDIDTKKAETFTDLSVNWCESIENAVNNSDVVFLCVKPQNFGDVMPKLKGITENKLIVTIAAGISTGYIAGFLGESSKIIRVMPNTPLLLGAGASALSKTQSVSDSELSFIFDIFSNMGTAEILPESLMNEVVGVNGSSPAYIYLFAKAVVDSAVSQGIDDKTALNLIANTLIGSGKMLLSGDKTPDELIKMVSSPGGTTLEALKVLVEKDFCKIIDEAMKACTRRAYELQK